MMEQNQQVPEIPAAEHSITGITDMEKTEKYWMAGYLILGMSR